MKAAGGRLAPPSAPRESMRRSNSSAQKRVVCSSVQPSRYVSGHVSTTEPSGTSTSAYLLYGEMASVAAELPW